MAEVFVSNSENTSFSVLVPQLCPRRGERKCLVRRSNLFQAAMIAALLLNGFVSSSLVSNTVQAGVMRPDVPVEDYIAFGQHPMFDSTGAVSGFNVDTGQWEFIGTGVGVGDPTQRYFRNVLFTGHQAVAGNFSKYRFSLGPNAFEPPTESHETTQVQVIGADGPAFGTDLAVLNFSASEAFTSVYPSEMALDYVPAVGDHVFAAGYGDLFVYPDLYLGLGPKAGWESTISRLGDDIVMGSDRFRMRYNPGLDLAGGGAHDNSGSPIKEWIDDRYKLVGVLTGGVLPDLTVATILSAHAEPLVAAMVVPEPSSLALSGVALVCFVFFAKISNSNATRFRNTTQKPG